MQLESALYDGSLSYSDLVYISFLFYLATLLSCLFSMKKCVQIYVSVRLLALKYSGVKIIEPCDELSGEVILSEAAHWLSKTRTHFDKVASHTGAFVVRVLFVLDASQPS